MKMKKLDKTLPGFVSNISHGKMEILEDLIGTQYEEFRCIFELLKSFVDDITDLEHKESDSGKLIIHVHTESTKTAREIFNEAMQYLDSNQGKCKGDITTTGMVVKMKISRK